MGSPFEQRSLKNWNEPGGWKPIVGCPCKACRDIFNAQAEAIGLYKECADSPWLFPEFSKAYRAGMVSVPSVDLGPGFVEPKEVKPRARSIKKASKKMLSARIRWAPGGV